MDMVEGRRPEAFLLGVGELSTAIYGFGSGGLGLASSDEPKRAQELKMGDGEKEKVVAPDEEVVEQTVAGVEWMGEVDERENTTLRMSVVVVGVLVVVAVAVAALI